MTRRIKLALLLIVLSVHVGSAQGIPAADVKITYIQAAVDDKGFTCTVQVHNDNDDDAQNTIMVMLLPLEVEMLSSTPARCFEGPAFPAQGRTYCWFGHMAVGQFMGVQVRTTTPPRNRTCSAFVWNDVPDPNPVNNFGHSTAP